MSLAFFDDDLDFAVEFLVSLFNLKGIVFKMWLEAAANVKKRHVGFGHGGEIIERLRFRPGIVHARMLSVDSGILVGILNGPRVDFASSAARAFHRRFLPKAVSQSFTTGPPSMLLPAAPPTIETPRPAAPDRSSHREI